MRQHLLIRREWGARSGMERPGEAARRFRNRAVVRFRCGDYADRSCDRDQGGDSERKTSSSHLPFLTTFQSFG
jgi:hypothetical protein